MGLIDKIIKTRNHWFHRYDTTELVWSPQFVKDSPNAFGLRHAHLHTLRMCFSVSNLLSHVFIFVQTKQRSSEASDNEKIQRRKPTSLSQKSKIEQPPRDRAPEKLGVCAYSQTSPDCGVCNIRDESKERELRRKNRLNRLSDGSVRYYGMYIQEHLPT